MTAKIDPVEIARDFWNTGSPDDHLNTVQAVALCRVVLAANDLAVAWRDRTERKDGIKNVQAKHNALAAALRGRSD